MKATLLPTNIFHLFEGPCIHVSTIEECVHSQDSFIVMLRARMAFLYRLDNDLAAQCYNVGMVIYFSCATFDVEHKFTKCLVVSLSGANVDTGSIGLFTSVAESINLNLDSIGVDNLPVYLDL